MTNADATTPAQRVSLSPRAIVDAAVALADAQGLDAVTIRRVASTLDVTPMALYWHFRNKDELLAGMVDWVFGSMEIDLDPGAPWLDRLRALLEAEVVVLRAHPALAPLMLTHGGMGEQTLSVIDIALGVLFDGGFSPAEAVQVVRHLEQATVNLVLREQQVAPSTDPDQLAEREREALTILRELPDSTFSNIRRAAGPLIRCEDPAEYYGFGLDLLLAGVQAMANRRHGQV